MLDGRGDISPQIVFQVGKDEDQEIPASEASVSSVAIGVVGHRDDPMGERYLVPTIVPDDNVNTVSLFVSGGYQQHRRGG